MSNFELITSLISTLALIATSVSAVLIFIQIKSTNEWNRRKTTQEVLHNLTSGRLLELFRKVRDQNKLITDTEYQNKNFTYLHLFNKLNTADGIILEANIVDILNILENVCISIKNNIIDQDITYNMLYTFFIDTYYWTKPYILKRRSIEENDQIFAEFEYYATQWEGRVNLEKKRSLINKRNLVIPKNKL
jgi:uncharacterized protein YggT (Ycf19 family)